MKEQPCVCTGDFLHSTGSGAGVSHPPGPRAVILIQVSQKTEPLPVLGSLKHRNPFYSLPVCPLSPSSWRSPTEAVWDFCPWPKLLQKIGICLLGSDLHQKCLVSSCGKHRGMEIELLLCFPSPGMSELHGRGWQGSSFFQKSPCKP